MGGAGGQVYMGCRFPADPVYAAELARHGRAVGERLAAYGVIGRASIDFAAARDRARRLAPPRPRGEPPQGRHHPPLRRAPQHRPPAATTRPRAGGSAPTGPPAAYRATDNLVDPAWKGVPPAPGDRSGRGGRPPARPRHAAPASCCTCCRAWPSTAASASPPSGDPPATPPSSTTPPAPPSPRPPSEAEDAGRRRADRRRRSVPEPLAFPSGHVDRCPDNVEWQWVTRPIRNPRPAGSKRPAPFAAPSWVTRTSTRRSADPNPTLQELQDHITETAWGVWARGGALSLRDRSLLVLAMTAALGRMDEFALHAARRRAPG